MPDPASKIPSQYLELTIQDVLSLHMPLRPVGEAVPVEQINAAVAALAQRVAAERSAREREQHAWLADQFSALRVEGE